MENTLSAEKKGHPRTRRAIGRGQHVGPLPQRSGDDEAGHRRPSPRRRGLHAGIGHGIGRRVGGHFVPQHRAVGPEGVVPAHGGIGGVPRIEVHIAAGGRRHHRCGGVDRRVARHADAVHSDRRRCGGTVVPGDATRLTGPDGGRQRRARPVCRHRSVRQPEGVQRTGSITQLH